MNDPAAEIFLQARELSDPEERAAFVTESCRGDAELLAHVQRLLADEQEAESYFADIPLERVDLEATAISDAAPETGSGEQAGQWIGCYQLLELIGEGGFGSVWRAAQHEPVTRQVALKIIKQGMDTKQVVARFEAERQALAMMDHPNIAKVHDAGATTTGRPFFVMELVDGIKVTDYCDQNHLSTRERLELFIKICNAIQHAHQKGVIHRDIKPSNILVAVHDGVPVPKVIDFGIAKATEGKLTDATIQTQLHQLIGTPAYMSPEQAALSGSDIDTRSDIYSAGVLLYELLTSTTPFDTQELFARGLDAICRAIREEDPLRPSTRLAALKREDLTTTARRRSVEASKLVSQLRGDLDWIVMKCLEKDRTRRYETASAVAADILRHLNTEPVEARPPSKLYEFQKTVRRHKFGFAATAAIILVLAGGVIMSTWQAMEARKAQRAAEEARGSEREQRAAAEKEKTRAEAGERLAQQRHYAASMSLARQAWDHNDLRQLTRLLDETATYPDRGFEWYYWQRQLHREHLAIRTHDRIVNAAAYFPDGQKFATGGPDGFVRVWNADTAKLSFEFKPHNSQIIALVISKDGKRIVTCSQHPENQTVVSDAASGRTLLRFGKPTEMPTGAQLPGTFFAPPQENLIYKMALSPDDRRVLILTRDGILHLWDLNLGTQIDSRGTLGMNMIAPGFAFSPDSNQIAIFSFDGLSLLDSGTLRLVRKLGQIDEPGSVAQAMCFSPDGKRIYTGVTGLRGAQILVSEAATGRKLMTFNARSLGIPTSVSLSTDGKRVLVVSEDNSAKVLDAESGGELITLRGFDEMLMCAVFSPDGRWVFTGGSSRHGPSGKIWDSSHGQEAVSIGPLNFSAMLPDGQSMIEGSVIRELPSGRMIRQIVKDPVNFSNLCDLSDDGGTYAATLLNREGKVISIRILEVATGAEISAMTEIGSGLEWLKLSPKGERMVTVESDATKVWNTRTGICMSVLLGGKSIGLVAGFSPDGEHIVTGGPDGFARIWDSVTAKELMAFDATEPVRSVAFSRDGQRLVTGGQALITLWDTASGAKQLVLTGHQRGVLRVAFMRDERRLVSVGADQTMKLWDIATSQEILTLAVGNLLSGSSQLNISDDSRRIALASGRMIQIWEAATPSDVREWNTGLRALSAAVLENPSDTIAAMRLAALQVWFGLESEYSATRERMIAWAAGPHDPSTAERVAKLASLRPIPDNATQAAVLRLGRPAQTAGNGLNERFLPWYQLASGMAEYRGGHFSDAIEVLAKAATGTKTGVYRPELLRPAIGFYAAMSLLRHGQKVRAREEFDRARTAMPPLPKDDLNPLADGADHDHLILWLAFRESAALFSQPGHN